jgi:hypothetical protein
MRLVIAPPTSREDEEVGPELASDSVGHSPAGDSLQTDGAQGTNLKSSTAVACRPPVSEVTVSVPRTLLYRPVPPSTASS